MDSWFKYSCEECEGENVKLHGWLKWNVKKQDWEQTSFPDEDEYFGEYYCEDCKKIVEVVDEEYGYTLDEILDRVGRNLG